MNAKLSDVILRTMSICSEILGEMDSILTDPYKYSLGLPYEQLQIRRSVKRLVDNGYIHMSGKGILSHYELSDSGRKKLAEKVHSFMNSDFTWDGKWRVVVFDIEERYRRKRDRFRSFIKSLGFGKLQKSIWLTPFPVTEKVEELIQKSGLQDKVLLIETNYVGGIKGKKIVEDVWKVSLLDLSYQDFINRCRIATHLTKDLRQEFIELICQDPFLPRELLPEGWGRNTAIKTYNSLIEREMSLYVHDRE
jgi:phenylacetic acid degradation operon negative regulatory protein